MTPEQDSETIHECDWCINRLPCTPARAGTGTLWICDDCLTDALIGRLPEQEADHDEH
jgi:hypothetical protein